MWKPKKLPKQEEEEEEETQESQEPEEEETQKKGKDNQVTKQEIIDMAQGNLSRCMQQLEYLRQL